MIKKLKDIATILSGNAWSSTSFSDEGIPIIRINNMNTNNGNFVYWQDAYDEKYIIKSGDILLSLSGTIKIFIWNGPNALLNQRIVKLSINDNVNQKWVFYQLSYLINKLTNNAKDAGIKNVSIEVLKDFEIIIPEIEFQNKVVKILNKTSKILENRNISILLLETLLKSNFIYMFGDPVFNKKEWEVKTLRNIISKIDAGWSPVCEKESRTLNDEWAVLKQGAVSRRVFNPEENKLLPKNIEIKKKITAQKGDLLFSRKNSKEYVGSTAYVYEEYEKLLLPDTIFNLKYNREIISPIYLEHLFNDNNFRIVIQNLRSGAASSMPNISQSKLLNLEIPVPNIDLQNRFERIVLEIYEKKKKVINSLIFLEKLFNSTIQRAFNGQLNFNVSVEVDALLKEIDIEQEKNDLSLLTQDIAYLQNFVDRLNEQDFENQELYDKAKHVAFQLLKEEKYMEQQYNELSKSIKVVLK